MHLLKWHVFISVFLLFSSCWFGDKLKDPKIEITQIRYTINLTEQDEQGFYIVETGQPVIIKATATGSHVEQVQWNTTMPKPLDGEDGLRTNPEQFLTYLKSPKTIAHKQILYFVIKDPGTATTYEFKCFFAGNQKTVNGVDLFQGEQKFKLRVKK